MAKKTTTKKSKQPAVDSEVADVVCSAARRVWNEIGYDVLQMVEEQDGKDTVSREEVIELVCDAGRLDEEIARTYRRKGEQVPPAVTELLKNYGTLERVIKAAFPYARYGM